MFGTDCSFLLSCIRTVGVFELSEYCSCYLRNYLTDVDVYR